MSEPRVDQLYCTHCTYSTAALHRREGEAGKQVFEESTRAGSVARERSHDVYTRFASCVVFHVPGDMPSELMVHHTARSLPLRRMIYLPSVGGYRLLAQVCFRQQDTRGRPGAYFAHVLIQDMKEFPVAWSPLECLELWGAKQWVIEDGPDLPFDLSPFKTLQDFNRETAPLINDEVLRSFLTGVNDSDFTDGGVIIPDRWRQQPPAARQKLLVNLLQAVLNLDLDRREQLLIVVEPSVAALLYYGIFRLLPPVGVAEKLSFSTYESHKDRMVTTLAATCFHNPATTDLAADWYAPHARGAAFNTFKTDRHTPLKKTGQYAPNIVQKFIGEGAEEVDKFRRECGELQLGKPEELEGMSQVDGQVEALLKPQSKDQLLELERSLPRDGGLRAFLRKKLVETMSSAEFRPRLSELLEHPPQALLVFKLLTESDIAGCTDQLDIVSKKMLANWPDGKIGQLLADKDVPKEYRVKRLNAYVSARKSLPEDAEALFFARGSIGSKERLLEEVWRDLHGDQLRELVEKTVVEHPKPDSFCEVLRSLVPLTANSSDHERAFRDLFRNSPFRDQPEQLAQSLDAVLTDKVLRDKLSTTDPFDGEPFSEHLRGMLNSLDKMPHQLDQQLGILGDLKHFIPDCRVRLDGWRDVSAQIKSLHQLNLQPVSVVQKILGQGNQAEKEAATKELAYAARRALPQPEDYFDGDPRTDIVVTLCRNIMGESGVPEHFHSRLGVFFRDDQWPAPRTSNQFAELATKRNGIIAGSVVAALVVIVFALQMLRSPSAPPADSKDGIANTNRPQKPTDKLLNETDQGQLPDTPPDKKKPEGTDQSDNVASGVGKKPKGSNKPVDIPQVDTEPKKPPFKPTLADPGSKQKKPATTAALPTIAWEGIFALPSPTEQGSTAALVSNESNPDKKLNPVAVYSTLQQWMGEDHKTKRSAEEIDLILKDIVDIKLSGIDQLNEYLDTTRDPDLFNKDVRLFCELSDLDAAAHSKSLRVFKLSVADFKARSESGSKKSALKRNDQLCAFDLDQDGFHFGWAATTEPMRRKLQQMLCYCLLEIKQTSVEKPAVIPLLMLDQPVLAKPTALSKSESKLKDSQKIKIYATSPWTLQLPSSVPYGFDIFEWNITRVRVSANGGDFKPFEANFAASEGTTSGFDLPADLVPPNFEAVHVAAKRMPRPMSPAFDYSVVVSASYPLADLTQIAEHKKNLRPLLALVVINPDKPYRDAVKPEEIEPDSYDSHELIRKALDGNFRPKDWVDRMTKRLQECNSSFKLKEPPPTAPKDLEFSEKTTLDMIQSKVKLNPNLTEDTQKFITNYQKWVDRNLVHPACRQYLELAEAVKSTRGDSSELDTEVKSYCDNLQEIEIGEMSRRINGKWMVVPMRPRALAPATATAK